MMNRKREKSTLQMLSERGTLDLVINEHSAIFIFLRNLILQSESILQDAYKDWTYKSLAQLANESFASHSINITNGDKRNIVGICAREYGVCTHAYISFIDEGLPLYVKSNSGEFERATSSNEFYAFISGLVKYGGWMETDVFTPPEWALNLYIRKSDFLAYRLVYVPHWDLNDQEEIEENKKFKNALLQQVIAGEHPKAIASNTQQEGPVEPVEPSPKAKNSYLRTIAALSQALIGKELTQPHKDAGIILKALGQAGIADPVKEDALAAYLKAAGPVEKKAKS